MDDGVIPKIAAVFWGQPPLSDHTVKLELKTKPKMTFITDKAAIISKSDLTPVH